MSELSEVLPTQKQKCDNCHEEYDYWLLFFNNLNIYICEDCLESSLGLRNELRFGLRDEA